MPEVGIHLPRRKLLNFLCALVAELLVAHFRPGKTDKREISG
jgi:hypothetical protein